MRVARRTVRPVRRCRNQLPRVASASLNVCDGRMTAALGHRGLVVAADVGRLALDGDQLVDDLLLLLGQRRREGREGLGQLRVLGLLGQLLGPVQGQVEVAAAVVDAAELAAGRLVLGQERAGRAVEGVREDLARALPVFCARCSKLTASARNSPRLSQRR